MVAHCAADSGDIFSRFSYFRVDRIFEKVVCGIFTNNKQDSIISSVPNNGWGCGRHEQNEVWARVTCYIAEKTTVYLLHFGKLCHISVPDTVLVYLIVLIHDFPHYGIHAGLTWHM